MDKSAPADGEGKDAAREGKKNAVNNGQIEAENKMVATRSNN